MKKTYPHRSYTCQNFVDESEGAFIIYLHQYADEVYNLQQKFSTYLQEIDQKYSEVMVPTDLSNDLFFHISHIILF